MRVLHLYSGNLYGGVERMLVTLARQRGLAPEMQPEYGVCFQGQLLRELRENGAAVHPLGDVRFSRPWTVRKGRRALDELLSREKFDVAVTHSAWPHALFAPVARRHGLPLVFWAHNSPTGRHWIERLAARLPPDIVIANSYCTLADMPRLFPGTPASVVYCPVEPPLVDSHVRQAMRQKIGIANDEVAIILAARLERWKGHRLLIRALHRMRDLPHWQCWIAGGPQRRSEEDYFRALHGDAKRMGLQHRIRFLGQRSDIGDVLAAADVHCQPNLTPEPFGVAFVEALYMGLPVVTTRMGGAIEILDDSCGVLVPPDDESSLAGALSDLIARPERRDELACGGPARARKLCDPQAILPQLRDMLGRRASERRPAEVGIDASDHSRLRVLHLYAGNLYGGVERVLTTLARMRALAPLMEPHFGLCFEGRLSRELLEADVPPHLLGAVRFSRPWTVLWARRRLRELLRREQFDVAVCHSPWSHAVFAPAADDVGLPLVFWSHGVPDAQHWSGRFARRNTPALVLANSTFTARATEPLFPGVPWKVLHYPIPEPMPSDGEGREQTRKKLNTPADAVVIIICSRIERLKGHDVLIDALTRLRDRAGWECWIVGGAQRPLETRYFRDLRLRAQSAGIERSVKFLGERSDIFNLLTAADIHCQPNTAPEGFGVAFVEAMYAGLPVVTSAFGGAIEVVQDPDTGRLLPPDDVKALADALDELITSSRRRNEMGAAGRTRAHELCSPSRQIPVLARILSSVAQRSLSVERVELTAGAVS